MNFIILDNRRLLIRVPYRPDNGALLTAVDPRRAWDRERKLWTFPAEPEVAVRLRDFLAIQDTSLPQDVRDLIARRNGSARMATPPDFAPLDGYDWLTTPYEHQRRGAAELLANQRWLLAWEMGCGKSHVVCNRLRLGIRRSDFNGPILILCPKSVVGVWRNELRQHAGLECAVLEGTVTKKVTALRSATENKNGKLPIVVANYETLLSLVGDMVQCKFDVVVADECQRAKNLSTRTSKLLRKVSAAARYHWALSGTPAPNGIQDIFGTLTFLDPDILGSESKVALEARYCLKRELPNQPKVRVICGYKELDDLNARITSVSSRVLKADCLDLPPKVFVERRVKLEGDQARVYKEMKRQAVARLNEAGDVLSAKNVLTEVLRLLQICGGHVPDDDGTMHALKPNAKLEALDEVLEETGDKPVVIWCSFREELAAVAAMLATGEHVRPAVQFHGGCNDAVRREAIAWFQDNNSAPRRAFIATPQSGGMGITLTAADTEVFYSRTWNLQDWLQAVDRPHRIGQTRCLTVISLVADGTVDEKIAEALTRKIDFQELILRGKVAEVL